MAHAERGVTLIESLIALLVLAIALLGIASLQLLAQREDVEARRRSVAVTMSDSLIEQLRTDRIAAEKLSLSEGQVIGCDATNEWLCALIRRWEQSLSVQLPNAAAGLAMQRQTDTLTLATVSIAWQRVGETSSSLCPPPGAEPSGDVAGGCIRLETAL